MNPSASAPDQRPSLALLDAEPFRAVFEFARHHLVKANPSKPGDGHPVVIFPGLGADGRNFRRSPPLSPPSRLARGLCRLS
jgi:hypothetical protein